MTASAYCPEESFTSLVLVLDSCVEINVRKYEERSPDLKN